MKVNYNMDKIQENVVQPGQLCIAQLSQKWQFLQLLLSDTSQIVNWSLAMPIAMMLCIISFFSSCMEIKNLLTLLLCIPI